MKYLFIIQAEGRGHMTQAMALKQILTNNGHSIVACMVGETEKRRIPQFLIDEIACPMYGFPTPALNYGKGKKPNMLKTILGQLMQAKKYLKNGHFVHQIVQKHQPDCIVNFYEFAGGLYKMLYPNGVPMVSVGHQYLLLRKDFPNIRHKPIDRFLLNLNTKITCWGSQKILALSFRPFATEQIKNIRIVPPLLRQEVKSMATTKGDFLLAYTTHHRLAEDIIAWQSKHSHIPIHCFVDKLGQLKDAELNPNMHLHLVDNKKYMAMMAHCRALITTAGFESVCEAMYLGKPVMMVPVPNHIEQRINAHDGALSGAGIYSKKFKINKLINYLPQHIDQKAKFMAWAGQTDSILVQELTNITNSHIIDRPFKPQASWFQILFQNWVKQLT